MEALPVVPYPAKWQQQVAEEDGLVPRSALDCFITVDGENLADAILRLADLALKVGGPILFT
jgi:hypothetical protein